MGRYHYLGYRVPYGAQLRYLAFVSQPAARVVAALQLSSPAWRLAARDRWIGWDEARRARNLQRVVNNSRFLVLPVGAGAESGQPAAGVAGQAAGRRLAGPRFAIEPAAAGDAGGPAPLCRHLLPGCQLEGVGSQRRARSHGPRAMPAMGRHRNGCWCILWWPTLSAGWPREV